MVILGAGLDTHAYRLAGMNAVKVFELDLPDAQSVKKKKLKKLFGSLPENVVYLPINFDTQGLDTVFAGTAFDASRSAIFIMEGVSQYIPEEAVQRTLDFVGKSAPGSSLVLTYVLKSIIERRSDIQDVVCMMDYVSKSAPWVFGMEPSDLTAFLKPFHLALAADVGNADYQEKYLKPLGRKMDVTQGERIFQAVMDRHL